MKSRELAEIILNGNGRNMDDEVRVVVHNPGKIRPRSSVGLQIAAYGHDWEAGTFELVPAMPLTRLSIEDVEAIRVSVIKGQSWHAYQAHKALHERIKSLEAEVSRLKGLA